MHVFVKNCICNQTTHERACVTQTGFRSMCLVKLEVCPELLSVSNTKFACRVLTVDKCQKREPLRYAFVPKRGLNVYTVLAIVSAHFGDVV